MTRSASDTGGEWSRFAAAGNGLELFRAQFRTHVFDRHSHDAYSLGATEWGVQAFRYGRTHYASTAGKVIVFNPEDLHDGHAGDAYGFAYRMLYVPPATAVALLEDAWERPCGLPWLAEPLLDDAPLAAAVAAAHRGYEAADLLAGDTWLAEAFVRLATRHGRERPARPAPARNWPGLCRARECLHAGIEQAPTGEALAAAAGMSRFHLNRQFKAAFGLPPHAYLLHLRLAAARRRLAAGDPAADVAAALGFTDQSHLTRRFKRAYGVTPGQYAAALDVRRICGSCRARRS